MGELHDKHYYKKKTNEQKKFDKYLAILHEPKTAQQIAEELGIEYHNVYNNLQKMWKAGYVRKYVVNNYGRTVYVRKLEL